MKKIKELWALVPENVTVTRLDGVLIIAVSVLLGMVVGMICSPRKNAKYGCGNGTTTIYNWKNEDEEESSEASTDAH